MLVAICFTLDQSTILSSGIGLTLSKTSPDFYMSGATFVENTEGKGEKIARNKQFLPFHSIFYLSEDLPAIFIKFEIVVCKLLQFGRV